MTSRTETSREDLSEGMTACPADMMVRRWDLDPDISRGIDTVRSPAKDAVMGTSASVASVGSWAS